MCCWKNARPALQSIPVLQCRGQGLNKIQNYRTNTSPTFNKNQDLAPWIGEQQYIKMLVPNGPNIPDIFNRPRVARAVLQTPLSFIY